MDRRKSFATCELLSSLKPFLDIRSNNKFDSLFVLNFLDLFFLFFFLDEKEAEECKEEIEDDTELDVDAIDLAVCLSCESFSSKSFSFLRVCTCCKSFSVSLFSLDLFFASNSSLDKIVFGKLPGCAVLVTRLKSLNTLTAPANTSFGTTRNKSLKLLVTPLIPFLLSN